MNEFGRVIVMLFGVSGFGLKKFGGIGQCLFSLVISISTLCVLMSLMTKLSRLRSRASYMIMLRIGLGLFVVIRPNYNELGQINYFYYF